MCAMWSLDRVFQTNKKSNENRPDNWKLKVEIAYKATTLTNIDS